MHVGLEEELEAVALELDEPVVVAPADPVALDAAALLLEPRGHLDVAGLRDALDLASRPRAGRGCPRGCGSRRRSRTGRPRTATARGRRCRAGSRCRALKRSGAAPLAARSRPRVSYGIRSMTQSARVSGLRPAADVEHARRRGQLAVESLEACREHRRDASTASGVESQARVNGTRDARLRQPPGSPFSQSSPLIAAGLCPATRARARISVVR